METVNQETQATNDSAEVKTFTQEEVNSIVKERLDRANAKYSDYETLKEKATRLDELEEAKKTELEKANEQVSALKEELNSLKSANAIREIREKVASETGVPINLLTGETEDACMEQAKAILDYTKQTGYPVVKDGGEVRNISKHSTRDQFAEWANQAFGN